jgi:hypothetical protein
MHNRVKCVSTRHRHVIRMSQSASTGRPANQSLPRLEATAQGSAGSLNAPRISVKEGWVGTAIAGEGPLPTQRQFGNRLEYPPVGSGPP